MNESTELKSKDVCLGFAGFPTKPTKAYQVAVSFTPIQLTEEFNRLGMILSDVQEVVIKNLITACATELVDLEYDSVNQVSFAQQQGFLKGQIAILNYQLQCSAAVKNPETLE